MSLPRNLIEIDWFQTVATWNPVSYMLEGIRSLDDRAAGTARPWRSASPARAVSRCSPWWRLARRCARGWCAHERLRQRYWSVARAVAWRNAHNFFTNPAMIVPALLFPLFFFTAFAGGLSRVDSVPGFDYDAGYTTFVYGFVLLQASTFGGIFTGFAVARDFESGFSRRLMLAAHAARRASSAATGSPALARALFIDRADHRGRPARRASSIDGGRRRPRSGCTRSPC